MTAFSMLIPSLIFFFILLLISFYLRMKEKKKLKDNFSKEYYIGGRSLNGFVLAMSLVATYGSVSSFVGGPGVSWKLGLSWVLFASVQVVAAYLILGILGKKMAVVARQIDAITIIDLIRFRYKSDFCANLCAFVLLLFFTTQMIAQFVGGAHIFSAVTGMDYKMGLLFFAIVVVVYTSIGGFNTVAITDTLCAVMMLLGMFFLFYQIFHLTGGLENIMTTIKSVSNKQGIDMLSPTNKYVSIPLLMSQWILCGIGTVGLPQSAVRCISYKDTKSVHKAMIIGTIVCGAMMIGMPLIGFLGHGLILTPIDKIGSTDNIIPTLISQYMNPWLAGLTIIGPLAATMSTISSLLIAGSSAIVKDIYLHYCKADETRVSHLSLGVTTLMGIVTIILSINPPDIIVWINLFAFGGLETAFFWILIMGFFWQKANKIGAISSIILGLSSYCLAGIFHFHISTCHNIVIGIIVSAISFIIGSYLTKKPSSKEIDLVFFPKKSSL